MKIPGFTAEASIYKTSEQYHMVNVVSIASIAQVVPAMPCCSACDWAEYKCEQGKSWYCGWAIRCQRYCSPSC